MSIQLINFAYRKNSIKKKSTHFVYYKFYKEKLIKFCTYKTKKLPVNKKKTKKLLLDAWYTPLNLLLDVHGSNRKLSFVIDFECDAFVPEIKEENDHNNNL
jgi:hypothetical protein